MNIWTRLTEDTRWIQWSKQYLLVFITRERRLLWPFKVCALAWKSNHICQLNSWLLPNLNPVGGGGGGGGLNFIIWCAENNRQISYHKKLNLNLINLIKVNPSAEFKATLQLKLRPTLGMNSGQPQPPPQERFRWTLQLKIRPTLQLKIKANSWNEFRPPPPQKGSGEPFSWF